MFEEVKYKKTNNTKTQKNVQQTGGLLDGGILTAAAMLSLTVYKQFFYFKLNSTTH